MRIGLLQGPDFAVKSLGVEKFADRLAVGLIEFGAPQIADQDYPQVVAVVPGLVAYAVIKDPGFAFDPFARIAANSEKALSRYDERQMDQHTEIGHPNMGRDVRVRSQQREHQVGC